MSLEMLRSIAEEAGERIMEVYAKPFEVVEKSDASPLTAADIASHTVIERGLSKEFPEFPILSEESAVHAAYQTRRGWGSYWLVDPLDGTKEFVKRNGQFTVNIARIEDGRPVLGVVHVPATGVTYWGAAGAGAYKSASGGAPEPIRCSQMPESGCLRVVGSLSHRSPATEEYLEDLRSRYDELSFIAMGSSLKICLVAEGRADIYPRLAPTMEWDTAAAHAVLNAARGRLVAHETGDDLPYTKQSLRNPWFVAMAATNGGQGA